MPVKTLLKKSSEAVHSVMKLVFEENYKDPVVRKAIDDEIRAKLSILKDKLKTEEIAEPLPGEIAQEIVSGFCKDMIVSMYGNDDDIYKFVSIDVLSIEAYRINKDYDDYNDIIENLQPEFEKYFNRKLRKNKKCKMFTVLDICYIVILTISVFLIPCAAAFIAYRFVKEKRRKKRYAEENYLLTIRLLKYSELLTKSLYSIAYRDFDEDYQKNYELYEFKENLNKKKEEEKEEELFNKHIEYKTLEEIAEENEERKKKEEELF